MAIRITSQAAAKTASEARVNNTASATPNRPNKQQGIDAVKQARSNPLMIIENTRAKDVADQIKRMGNKQVTVIVIPS